MSSSILGIGSSALKTAYLGMSTASHNISNANTTGYTRQETLQVTNFATGTGAGFIGQGVHVASVRRVYSEFIARQAQEAQAGASAAAAYYQQLGQLDHLLGDASAGLSPALSGFFSAASTVASNPANGAARQSMLSSAETLAGRLDQMQSRLDEVRSGVAAQAQASVGQINTLAAEVARMNATIALAEARSAGQPANDLRDARDALITELNTHIQTTTVRQDDGAYNLFIGNGQPLVLGIQTASLSLLPGSDDPSRFVVGLNLSGTTQRLNTDTVSGGTLGGLLNFRSAALDTAQNALGRIAVGLAASVNAQHRLGLDGYGNPGGDLLTYDLPDGVPHADNSGNAVVALAVADSSALVASDYRLDFDGSQYSITRLADASTQSFASLPAEFDGLAFELDSGTASAGDSFLLRPYAQTAGSLEVAFSDPMKIAAAAPVSTLAPTANLGNARIGPASVDAGYLATPLAAPYTLTFSTTTGQLGGFPATLPVVVEHAGGTTPYAPGAPVTYVEGAKISVGGVSFTLSGTPANGDTFVVSPGSGAGDNRNLLALAQLQSAKLFAGTTSLEDAYGELVSQVGNQTRAAEFADITQTQLLQQANAARESVSGVNLDEEAANLLRYQQAYQAAGKVMQIASKLFDTLLSLGS